MEEKDTMIENIVDAMEDKEVQFKDHGHLDDMYEKISGYEARVHEENQHRIKVGIRCLWIIPLVFMFLMFLTDSSKLIFLVLWIVSLFAIAVYLIYVEYSDHKLQEQMNEIRGIEESEAEALIDVDARRTKAEEILSEMRENDKEAIDTLLGRDKEGEEA